MVEKNNEKIIRHYHCKVCEKTHTIELDVNVCSNRSKYPFPYVILHDSVKNGEVRELLTILYIDKNCAIRAAEIQDFDGHLFTKEQLVGITTPLMEEIKMLRETLSEREKEIKELKESLN